MINSISRHKSRKGPVKTEKNEIIIYPSPHSGECPKGYQKAWTMKNYCSTTSCKSEYVAICIPN